MVIKVGINSFGRIGRVIFRTCCENSEIKVSAINDPAIELDYMCYLIKYDSTLGKFSGTVSYEGNELKVNDNTVKVFRQKAPADIPWHAAGVEYVVEASGMFTSMERASGHLTSDTVRRVVVTGPSADAPMLILGVNENTIRIDMKVVSCASSTLYCLAPIVKILDDAYGVANGFVTSIHAMTPSLKPLDGVCGRGKHWRDHRSIHQNIIPATTGACRALGRVVPSCRDRMAGLAFRVPVVRGSVLDITIRLNKETTIPEISKTIEESKNPLLRNIIQVSKEKAVSSDFARDARSCILDINSSLQITSNFFKLICWYENEYSYSCRVIDTVLFLERQYQTQINTGTRFMYTRPSRHLQNVESSQGDANRQYVSFCVPNLKSNVSNMKEGLRNFELRPTSVRCSIHHRHQLGQPAFPEAKESITSYIDRLTKCQCNVKQHKNKDTHKKAENCFKEVEKDISNMLNMAEDILSKSSNKTIQPVKTSEIESNRIIMRKNIIAKISDTLEKIKKARMSAQNTDITGDQNNLDVDDYQDKVKLPADTSTSLKSSYCKRPKSAVRSKAVNSNFLLKKLNTCVNKTYKNYSMSDCTKSTVTNKLNASSFTNKLPLKEINDKSYHITTNDLNLENPTDDQEEVKTSTVANIVTEKLANTLKFLNVTQGTSKLTGTFPKQYDEDAEKYIRNNQSETVTASHKKVLFNIVNSNSNSDVDSKSASDSKENVKQSMELVDSASYEAKNIANKTNYVKKEVGKDTETINNYSRCSMNTIENDFEKCLSGIPSSYTIPNLSKNNSTYRNAPDIYDKLDSESMSDSGSSCRIRKKASQVINITDLTYSLEDLPRLDKICRVIEISDELSDKLFSPLDERNCENTATRKWSFQDMCERIKFDDFCDELFEKP